MNYLESKVKMNYLEIKVRELLEQVLRGEKRIPKLDTEEKYLKMTDKSVTIYSMKFSEDLSIMWGGWLRVKMQDKIICLFKEEYEECIKPGTEVKIDETTGEVEILTKERPKLSEEVIELDILFKEVWEYSSKIENDKWLIDKVFGEIK